MSNQPGSSPPSLQRQQAALPDWMRDPPPPRRTVGRRVSAALARRPAWVRLQRRWWAWQQRRRLYERFPIAFKIVAFFVAWILATALVLAAYAVFSLA